MWSFPPSSRLPPGVARRSAAGPGPGGSRSAPSILIIEDDPDILSTVADILEFEGYAVLRATNGAEGLAVVGRERPALVLLDMRMPVLNGWEFARALRERGISVPLLVMTAAQDARRWAAEIGAAGFVAKPFHVPDLLTAVETHLGQDPGGSTSH